MAILIDYSQLVIASCLAFGSDMDKGKDTKKAIDIIRHATLSSLLKYKTDYSAKYGEVILCADGGKNWRRDYFPYYKASRKGSREKSNTDWNTIFSFASELLGELRTIFPYRAIKVDEAEGDDIVAVLTKYLTENDTVQQGLVSDPAPILIVSSDGDFKQLHKFKNVRQWNPLMKKFVAKPEPDFLLEKVIKGDAGDGVPNVLSPDNIFTVEGRQKPVTAKVMDRFKSQNGLSDVEQRNFQRNRTLIDFDYIPNEVQEKILSVYNEQQPKRDLNAIMNYLMEHRCRLLLNDLQAF
jgi:hypothetical protein